ncbi:hypothetical protein CPB85DRAFT_86483 [Mucidula mucida]|nr:hypothetical protein CPB85DRAFT_86483 [Mucidula mucida]
MDGRRVQFDGRQSKWTWFFANSRRVVVEGFPPPSSTAISTSWRSRKRPRRRSMTRIRIGQRTCRCSLLWRSTPRCKRTFVFWEPWRVFTEEWRGLRKLFDLSDRAHPTVQVVNHLDTFVDVHGKAVVIGDAAHAAPINGTYNAALAVEDAFTLGHLFTRITSRSDIASLFSGYNEIRFNRTRATERSEIQGLLSRRGRSATCATMGLGRRLL